MNQELQTRYELLLGQCRKKDDDYIQLTEELKGKLQELDSIKAKLYENMQRVTVSRGGMSNQAH